VLGILDSLEDSLKLATIDENWKNRVGRQTELREKFNAPDLTIRFQGPFQIINLEGHEITIGSLATDEQIGAEIAKLRQEKPMVKSLNMQGLAGKFSKLKHDVEHDAAKMADRIDSVSTRKDAAFSKGHQYLDTTESHIGEVEQFVTDLEAVTNGAPE
jgi:hypothetical protein